MKNIIIVLGLLLGMALNSAAQDVVIKKDGAEIEAKVLEILPEEIKFKYHNNPDGPVITVLKEDVFMIKYANGTKEVFKTEKAEKPDDNNHNNWRSKPGAEGRLSAKDMYLQGQIDAKNNYKANGPFMAGFISTLLFPPAGIITATAISLTPPKQHNLNLPDVTLTNNHDYYDGYIRQAKRKKAGQVWIGAGTGILALSFLSAIINK